MTLMLKLGTTLSCSVLETLLWMLKLSLYIHQTLAITLLELCVTSGEELKTCMLTVTQFGLCLKLLR